MSDANRWDAASLNDWFSPTHSWLTICTKLNAERSRELPLTMISLLLNRSMQLTNAQQHHVASWAAGVTDPRALHDLIIDRPTAVSKINFLHGATWQTMLDRLDGPMPPDRAFAFGVDLCRGISASTAPWLSFSCLHGVGHGALYLGLRASSPAEFGASYGVCEGSLKVINVTEVAMDAAESICAAAPSAELAHVCAEGLYMSYRALMEPLSSEQSMSDRIKKGLPVVIGWTRYANYQALISSKEMAACARRRFTSMCAYQVHASPSRGHTTHASLDSPRAARC